MALFLPFPARAAKPALSFNGALHPRAPFFFLPVWPPPFFLHISNLTYASSL